MTEYFKYLQDIKFGKKPDYQELIDQFKVCLKECGSRDLEFDWVNHKQFLIEKRDALEAERKREEQLRKAKQGKLDLKKVEAVHRLATIKQREAEEKARKGSLASKRHAGPSSSAQKGRQSQSVFSNNTTKHMDDLTPWQKNRLAVEKKR